VVFTTGEGWWRRTDEIYEGVRIGEGLAATGELSEEPMRRGLAAVDVFAHFCRATGIDEVEAVATSAIRDATNREEFRAMVLRTLGMEPEVIAGREEATLSFVGAVRELTDTAPPRLVADIGGGSTELVLGDGAVEAAHSMDIGSVRLTERHLHDDPPTDRQIAAAEYDLRDALVAARRDVPIERMRTFVGVSGTVTTVSALAQGLERYDPDRTHHSRITAAAVRETSEWLLRSSHAQRAAKAVIQPGRVDVIGAGALILRVLTEETGAAEVVVSEKDILDGIAWSIVENR
jgi:exopolyphosphatase / guanosine-5'-triphosphate,3'-diphosphate pyrophosphatase